MKQLLYCLFGVLLLNSCEYDIHENFVELEKPSGELEMGIELNVENNGEAIVIQDQYAQIPYNLVTHGLKPIGCIFRIGDVAIEQQGGSGTLNFGWFGLPQGDYTLICEVYLYTGSGSVAEEAGYESYMGKYEWPLKVVYPNDLSRQLKHRINEEGYLELSWDKIPVGITAFDYYRLTSPDQEIIIRDINQTSFVHRSYIGGWRWYQVFGYFNDDRAPWLCGSLDLMGDLNLTLDYSREDSIVVRWSNPYQTVISVQDISWNWIVNDMPDRTFCIPYGPFGTSQEYMRFRVKAAREEDREEEMEFGEYLTVNNSRGTLLSPQGNWARIGYNPLLSQLYVSSYSEVISWSVPSLEPTGEQGRVPYHVYGYGFSASTEKVVVYESSTVYILNGKDLSTTITMPTYENLSIIGEPVLTADDKLLSIVTYPLKLHIYNAVFGHLEYSFDLPAQHLADNQSYISPDGKFVYYVNETSNIGVLALDNYQITGQSVIQASYEAWCVNPLQPEQLFVSERGRLTCYNGRSGSVTGQWNIPADMRVSNIDPDSGLLLLYSEKEAMIFNPVNGQELYFLPVLPWGSYRLYGNTIISDTGYALYLGKELAR